MAAAHLEGGCAAGLGVSWHTANSAILAEGKRRLIDDPHRFDGVTAIGVDEHAWRHTGFKTVAAEELPDAVPVMDPFHVVRLAGDPLYNARRTLHTGAGLLTEKQRTRLEAVFAVEEHVEVEATWGDGFGSSSGYMIT